VEKIPYFTGKKQLKIYMEPALSNLQNDVFHTNVKEFKPDIDFLYYICLVSTGLTTVRIVSLLNKCYY